MIDRTTQFATRIVVNIGVLLSLLLHFHGEESPGGGFQGGALFASSVIIFEMVFHLAKDSNKKLISFWNLEFLSFLGILMYFGCGIATLLAGGSFLEYNAFQVPGAISKSAAQKIGITVVETGVFLVVSSTMIKVWHAFTEVILSQKSIPPLRDEEL